jgi:hypothetical protein
MFEPGLSELDVEATLGAIQPAQAAIDAAETQLLRVAAHWADLHAALDRPGVGA